MLTAFGDWCQEHVGFPGTLAQAAQAVEKEEVEVAQLAQTPGQVQAALGEREFLHQTVGRCAEGEASGFQQAVAQTYLAVGPVPGLLSRPRTLGAEAGAVAFWPAGRCWGIGEAGWFIGPGGLAGVSTHQAAVDVGLAGLGSLPLALPPVLRVPVAGDGCALRQVLVPAVVGDVVAWWRNAMYIPAMCPGSR